jgi:hypothetical protein
MGCAGFSLEKFSRALFARAAGSRSVDHDFNPWKRTNLVMKQA